MNGLTVSRPNKKETLCWHCKHASSRREHHCTWSQEFIPVKGWKAIKGKVMYQDRATVSYEVRSCPNFKPLRE